MTALSDEIRADALEAIAEVGADGTLVDPNPTYSTDGSTTESATSYAVTLAGPLDESKRYAASATDARVTATFYVAATSALTERPSNGWRVLFGGRTFVVVASFPFSVNGIDVAYRLDVGEVGA